MTDVEDQDIGAQLELEPPLRWDDSGTIRVGKTRIPIDTVIFEYRRGTTPEQIVDAFDVLKLADVYKTISFYLSHHEAVDQYLQKREEEAEQFRRENSIIRHSMHVF